MVEGHDFGFPFPQKKNARHKFWEAPLYEYEVQRRAFG